MDEEGLTPEEVLAFNQPLPPEMSFGGMGDKERLKKLYDLQQAQINSDKEQLKGRREILGKMAEAPVQTDLSPLMALTDSWTGSHLAQGYKAPETGAAREQRMSAYEDKLMRHRDKLTENQQKILASAVKEKMAEAMLKFRGAQADAKAAEKEAEPPKASQAAAAGYGHRIEKANKEMDELTSGGYNRADPAESVKAMLPEGLQSENAKKQRNAERNFINAVLRRESGAAISASEFAEGEKQYFPRINDTAEVLEQKRLNRAQQEQSLKAEAGDKAYKLSTIPAAAATPKEGGSDSKVAGYARDNGISYAKALKILSGRGYTPSGK
jgi:hypothetical protein